MNILNNAMYPRLLASRTIGLSNNKKQPFTEEFQREEWFKILTDKCRNIETKENDLEQDLQNRIKQYLIEMCTHKYEHEYIIREYFVQCFIEMKSPFNYVELAELIIYKILTAEVGETGEEVNVLLNGLIWVHWLYCKIIRRTLLS